MNKIFKNYPFKNHSFHIVEPSFFPIYISGSLFFIIYILLKYKNTFYYSIILCNEFVSFFFFYFLFIFLFSLISWFKEMNYESTGYEQIPQEWGYFWKVSPKTNKKRDIWYILPFPIIYTNVVKENLLFGMVLFIISEIMLFFSFFWAYFHVSLLPNPHIGNVWPPIGIYSIDPLGVPLFNTVLLLFSGVTINCFFFQYSSFYSLTLSSLQEIPLNFFFKGLKKKSKINLDIFFYFLVLNKLKNISFIIKNISFLVNKDFRFLKIWKFLFLRLIYFLKFIFFFFWKYNFIWLTLLEYIYSKWRKKVFHFVENNIFFYFTIILGFIFVLCQLYEFFYVISFNIDNIYGSVFFWITGLHGFHVIIGLFFFLSMFTKLPINFFYSISTDFCKVQYQCSHSRSIQPAIHMTCAVWYWHFVDIVWLFVFSFIYIWGS